MTQPTHHDFTRDLASASAPASSSAISFNATGMIVNTTESISVADDQAHTTTIAPHGPCGTHLFSIPPQDRIEFHALPLAERENIQLCLEAFAHVAGSASKERAFRTLALSFQGRSGFSYKSLKRRYYEYLEHNGDWRWLVNAAVVPRYAALKRADSSAKAANGLTPAFLDFWHKLGLQNKRKWRPAWKKLKRLWREGESIPGYGTWRDWFRAQFPAAAVPAICPDLFPEGWSYANLMRHKAPKPQEVAARIGSAAAREFLPHVLSTRAGLRFLEHVTFDDVKTDFRVLDPASGQICDLWLLVAHDKATDMRLAYGMRPAVARDDGTQTHLRLRDMKQLAGSLLLRYGIPPYPVTWKVERGTATFSAATALAIKQLFQDKIHVSYSSMLARTAPSGYREKAVGNSRAKAGHEAGNNLLHNECGDLPGQTGRRYDVRPTDLAAREKETLDLINRAARVNLPEQLRSQLRFSLLTVKQAKEILDAVFERINHRTEHECEGFEEVIVWRSGPADPWHPLADLPPEYANGAPLGGTSYASPPLGGTSYASPEFAQRLETPFERMHRLAAPFAAQWQHVHPADIVHFFEDSHRIVEINKRGEIAFEHEKKSYTFLNPDPLRFRPGQELLAFYHPQDLTFIHLTQLPPHGGYVGTWPQRDRIAHGDKEALAKALEYTAQVAKLHFETLNQRHADEAAANEQRRAHNAALLAEHQANQSAIVVSDANPEGIIPIAPDHPQDSEGRAMRVPDPSPVGQALHFLRTATAATRRSDKAAARDLDRLNQAADAALDENYQPSNTNPTTNLNTDDL